MLDYYDLSYQKLTKIPDLSQYHIKHLNLSHNNIQGYAEYRGFVIKRQKQRLPKGLEILNLSHNELSNLLIYDDSIRHLRVLNASHNNHMRHVYLPTPRLEFCNLSHNNILDLEFDFKPYLRHLNISHNPSYTGDGLHQLSGLDTISCSKCSTTEFAYFKDKENRRGVELVTYVDTLLVKKAIMELPYKIKVVQ